jgi:hypothetical protein
MALQVNAQSAKKDDIRVRGGFGIWGFDAGFLGSANAKNSKDSKPLWAGNGYSAGLAYRYGDRWGITGRAGYAGGKTNTINAQTYANTLVSSPYTAKIAGLKSNWSQLNIASGPSVLLGKKYQAEVNATGGISISSARTIRIDRYDAQTFVNTVFEATEKKIKPYWEVAAAYQLPFGKGRMGLKAAYGNNGVSVGLRAQFGGAIGGPIDVDKPKPKSK